MIFVKRVPVVLAIGIMLAVASGTNDALAYLIDAGIHVPLNYLTFLPPAAGGSYVDSNFGTSIKRLSNALGTKSAVASGNLTQITNEYSTMSPFNNDNTFLILQHDSYFGLYTGAGDYLRDLPFAINTGAEPRWSRTDPNVLYFLGGNQLKQYNVSTQVMSVVHTFQEYSAIRGMGESDISVDGNHFVLIGDSQEIFVYEISTDRKSAVFNTGGRSFDSLYITPHNNVTVTWFTAGTARYNGIEMFDSNMNFLRQVARAGGHMDVAQDVNGDEVLLWANAADPTPVCNNGIVKIRLADASQTCLITFDWSLAMHVSAPDNNGWVFVETYTPGDPNPLTGLWPKYTNEIVQVKLDGSEVRRIAHHRSRPFNSYWYTPRTTTSHDGSKLVFSSNFGLQALLGYPTEYSDVYMIDLGGGSTSPVLASTTPTTTPAPGVTGQAPGCLSCSTLNSITPAIGVQGTNIPVTLTGTAFDSSLTVNAGSGLTVSDVRVTSATSATATLSVASIAVPEARAVTVSTSSGTSNAATYKVIPLQTKTDFNGDGERDILWRDAAGNVSISLMNGYTAKNSLVANISAGWSIVGTGDFNGDGKSDILWCDTESNMAVWLMDGTSVIGSNLIASAPPGSTIAGISDFNGDGKADILWRDISGNVSMWLMNGYSATKTLIGNIWTGWTIVGSGDFNGDGKSDILWRDTTGKLAIWMMNGAAVSSWSGIGNAPTSSVVVGVADFNGDGKADILFRDTSGDVSIWLMNGYSATRNSIASIWTDWAVFGTGDFDGDGKADILWRDGSGNMAIWMMNGAAVSSWSSIGNVSDRMAQ
jgi:hypothetical protein